MLLPCVLLCVLRALVHRPDAGWLSRAGARRYISRADFERLVRQLIVDKNTRRLGVLRQHAAFAWWPQERLLKLSNFLMPFALPMHAVL